MSEFSEDDYVPEVGGYSGARYGGGSEGHPAIATAICALLLVASCAGSRGEPIMGSGDHRMAELLGYLVGGVLVAAFFWAIAYAITIRNAATGWKIGSLVGLCFLGLLTAFARIGMAGLAPNQDVQEIRAQMEELMARGNGTDPIVPPANARPLTRLMASMINARLADSKAFDTAAKAAGLEEMVNFSGLTKSTPALDHCDRVAALADIAATGKQHATASADDARKSGAPYVARGDIPQGELDDFVRGVSSGIATGERQWTVAGQIAVDAGAMCRILARRHWNIDPSGKVLFYSDADLSAAQPILERLRSETAELQSIQQTARGKMTDSVESLRDM